MIGLVNETFYEYTEVSPLSASAEFNARLFVYRVETEFSEKMHYYGIMKKKYIAEGKIRKFLILYKIMCDKVATNLFNECYKRSHELFYNYMYGYNGQTDIDKLFSITPELKKKLKKDMDNEAPFNIQYVFDIHDEFNVQLSRSWIHIIPKKYTNELIHHDV